MYPIYDRSGVDDDLPRPLAQSGTAPSPRTSAPQPSEVLVCHAGTCRRAGAEAVLAEIEELVNASGGSDYCTVRQSGCLGYCSEAPNAVVRQKRSGNSVHMRLRSMEATAKVAERVTGSALVDGPANGRLEELRLANCTDIMDITPLASCTSLRVLDLGTTQVAKLSPAQMQRHDLMLGLSFIFPETEFKLFLFKGPTFNLSRKFKLAHPISKKIEQVRRPWGRLICNLH